jgi:hypothetical protein
MKYKLATFGFFQLSVAFYLVVLFSDSCQLKIKPEFVADDKQLAEREIDTLHKRFNSGDVEAIYNQEAPGLKQAISKEKFFAFLSDVHNNFGDFKGILDKRITVVMGPPVQFRAVCNSQFDKGVLTEMFIFLRDGDQIQLAQYTIAKGPAKLPDVGK